MLTLPPSTRVFVATRHTDMRKSFDSLAALVRDFLARIRCRVICSCSATAPATG